MAALILFGGGGDLADLVLGRHPGRRDTTARTVFKSAGMALEDLAAAMLAQDGSA